MCMKHRRARGLTFTDLMATLAIFTLLLGAAVPNLQYFFLKQQADAHAHLILRHMQKTREIAVLSGRNMTICGLNEENICSPSNFRTIAIFQDANENRKVDEDEIIESQLELDFEGRVLLRAGAMRFIRYYHHGGANPMGGFVLCPQSGDATLVRRISTQMAGRPYLARSGTEAELLASCG
jgi:Tfp pilus assembly protein FimT